LSVPLRPIEPSIVFVLSACAALACSKAADTKPDAAASAVRQSPDAPSAAPPPPAPEPVQSKPGCRVLAVTGKAKVDGAPIEANALLDGEHWVELETSASLSLRHTATTRELKLIGPAKVLPCRAGAEHFLLAMGQLSTSANLGVRPGAEVLIATPQGTVRYGDAALDIELTKTGLRVRVKQGEAWVDPEAQGKPRFKNPVRSGGEARLQSRAAAPAALVATCQTAARAAAESAVRVLTPAAKIDAGTSSLGERAAEHMRARVKARVECAMAAAAIGALPTAEATERETLSASVAQADELWRNVPRAIPGQKN
jgi:hypothetical protein